MTPQPNFNLADHVLAHCRHRPDAVALEVLGDGGPCWSYRTLRARIMATSAALSGAGIGRGDRVLMRIGNTVDFPVVFLSAIALDAIPIPTSVQLTTEELNKIVSETRPAAIVASPDIALPDTDTPTLWVDDLVSENPDPVEATPVLGDPERPAYIIYTSGTSGQPRAVVHAHRTILGRRPMWTGWYDLRPSDRMLHAGAFNWTYTLGTGLLDPWTCGATALIPAPDTPAEDLPRMIADHSATLFAAAPGVYRRMLRSEFGKFPALRHGLSAGEKLPEVTRERWQRRTGTAIHEAYGMSECSTFISASPARPAPAGRLGYPQPGRRLALIGTDGPVEIGETGTIAIHRSDPGLMLGYLDEPAETAARFQGDWFLTGDLGCADPDGAIAYLGRADDMMNAGGVRVSPIEVEAVLNRAPGITEVACAEVRVRDDLSLIAAFLVSDAPLDDGALSAFAAQHLASYKVPRLFVPVAALPRGTNNKVLRRQLRENWEAEHGQT